jgi:hypothetical protein
VIGDRDDIVGINFIYKGKPNSMAKGKKTAKKVAKKAVKKKATPVKRAKKTAKKKTPAKKSSSKKNKLGVKNSLVNNINARKKKSASRSKKKSTVDNKSYNKMRRNWK